MKMIPRPSFALCLTALTLTTAPTAGHAQSMDPPVAAIAPVELEIHGDVRTDPYLWLRDRDDPAVLEYLGAENAYYESQMAPLADLRSELYEEIRGRIRDDEETVPYRLGGHFYYRRFAEGAQYPIIARKSGSLEAREQLLLDGEALAEGHVYYDLRAGSSAISPSGRYLAWSADTSGRRFFTVRVLDMETGQPLSDVIPDVTGNLVWASDNRTLFYSKQDPETLRSYRIYRHVLGTDPAGDQLVYEEPDSTFSTYLDKTRDGRFILIESGHTLSTEIRVLDAEDPEATPRVFLPRSANHEYYLEHAGDHFYILTNREAENFRVMRAPEDASSVASWEEVIPHRDDVLVLGIEPFRDNLVVEERRAGLTRLRIRPWERPDEEHFLAFDEAAYAVALGDNPRFDTDTLRFVYESPAVPPTTYDYDMSSRERVQLHRREMLGGYNPGNYRVERLTAPADDGEGIPVTLVYREGSASPDGTRPLLLYGYGSYGASIPPFFDPDRISLLDRGFAFAIAHIRGSQTLGRHWYEDGKLLRKMNTFTDFIDVADHLVAEGYADPDRLYAMGASAGGLLMGAVMNLRPELYDGVIAHVPFVDVVTTMLDETIPLTTFEYDEWGNPNDPVYYRYMLSYSPYDNVAAADYPHLLVTTGLNDSQVQYWEPAKWVARLRATRTGNSMLLLETNMEAGHGGSTGRYERYRETARDYAFLIHLAEGR